MRAARKNLRCLQLYVKLLNMVHENTVFTFKLFSIGTCIVTGYVAIAHSQDYPVFGIMYYAIFIDCFLVYMLIYEKGFKVPDMFRKAKRTLRLRAQGRGRAHEILKRQLMSIPAVGIKVGDFHMLERTSTPVFVDYILTNVVNMLVAYR